jgi:putative DNA primase/helicase
MTEIRQNQVNSLLDCVRGRISLFADAKGEPYAQLADVEGGDVLRLRGRSLRSWLDHVAYEATGSVPTSDVRSQVLSILEGNALFDAPRRGVHVRLAEHGGAIWLDLGGPGRDAVRVDARGWTLLPSPVAFVRPPSLRPIAAPRRADSAAGEPLAPLRALLPQLDAPTFTLFVGWMLGALRPRGPYPLLVLQGERGSGKSTLARAVKILLDASTAPLRSMPKGERDLAISTTRAWIGVYDNLAPVAGAVSDALCRISTGGGLATRKLFTDDDEIVHDVCRPVVLTGIEDLAVRSDLADRAIVLRLSAFAGRERREESAILSDLEVAAPGILAGLLDGVSAALAGGESHAAARGALGDAPKPPGPLPRMADFARWVWSAEPALGWEPGTFLRAYEMQQSESDEVALEHDAVAQALLRLPGLAEAGRWEGTATTMWQELLGLFEQDGCPKPAGWPRAPNRLVGRLRELAPALRAHGIDFASLRTATSRLLVVTRRPMSSAPPKLDDGSGEWPAIRRERVSA